MAEQVNSSAGAGGVDDNAELDTTTDFETSEITGEHMEDQICRRVFYCGGLLFQESRIKRWLVVCRVRHINRRNLHKLLRPSVTQVRLLCVGCCTWQRRQG